MDSDMKWVFVICVLGVAFLHFIGTIILTIISGLGGGAASTVATQVLTFPLSMVQVSPDNPYIGWGAWILLSLGWGFHSVLSSASS
jgi:hypothetical protein